MTDDDDRSWGMVLRALRRRFDLSQRQLAERAGVPKSTIGDLETGRSVPTVATLQRALGAVGYRLEVVDPGDQPVWWDDSLEHPRDAAERRFPAHLDLYPRYPDRPDHKPTIGYPGGPWTFFTCRAARDQVRFGGHFGTWGPGPPTPGQFDVLEILDRIGDEDVRRLQAIARARLSLIEPRLRAQPSQRNQRVPSGGSRSGADAGRPCHPTDSATTPPRLPTPDPP